jgi:KaiC/GvpD/RAD55 family RecA-like ATPase
MVQILVEVQKLREIPHDNMMHDPSILRIAEEEEAKIMQQLTVLAELWQKTEGVTA